MASEKQTDQNPYSSKLTKSETELGVVASEKNKNPYPSKLTKSKMELGPECLCEINKQGEKLVPKDVTQTQQQRSESSMMTITWHVNNYKVRELHQRCILKYIKFEDAPVVEFMYLVFICMPGESYCR